MEFENYGDRGITYHMALEKLSPRHTHCPVGGCDCPKDMRITAGVITAEMIPSAGEQLAGDWY